MSSLFYHSDAYILVKGTIAVPNTAATDSDAKNTNKKLTFKYCAPFINRIKEINNAKVDNAKDIDIIMPMYNLIEHSDNYSKLSGSFWHYCKDMPAVNNNGDIVFNFKAKIFGQTGDNGTKEVPLKYLNNFWRTLEISLINWEINLILTWSANCVIVYTNVQNQGATFANMFLYFINSKYLPKPRLLA